MTEEYKDNSQIKAAEKASEKADSKAKKKREKSAGGEEVQVSTVKDPVIIKVHAVLDETMLGTASANEDIHRIHIALKSGDKEKVKEEMASLSAEELEEKSLTILHKDPEGNPILFDYQVKGFIKEALSTKVEFAKLQVPGSKMTISKWTYKRIVDNFVFVYPRQIPLVMPEKTAIGLMTRPLRAETMQGERVALATSETVPAKTELSFEVEILEPALEKLIRSCLDYGRRKGLGQWRNAGWGRFTWKEVA